MLSPELHFARDAAIPRDEWLAVAADDGELRAFRIEEGKTVHHWTAHKVRGEHPRFCWFDEKIDAEPYDRATLGKALALAARLGAAVMDDGRVYTSASEFGASAGSVPPASAVLLGDVLWSFSAGAPTDPAGFEATVRRRQAERGWDPDAVVLATGHVRVSCRGRRSPRPSG